MRTLVASAILCSCLLCACGNSRQKQKKPEIKKEALIPAKVEVTDCQIHWKREAGGKLEKLFDVDAVTGSLLNQQNSGLMELHAVHGKVYQKGLIANTFYADKLVADQKTKIAIAKGHAVIKSVAPEGTLISADKITINMITDRVVCEGHTKVVTTSKDGRLFTQTGGIIRTDTHLREITVEN